MVSIDTRRAGPAPTNVYFVSATALHVLKETYTNNDTYKKIRKYIKRKARQRRDLRRHSFIEAG
jgi:hypothetical protein